MHSLNREFTENILEQLPIEIKDTSDLLSQDPLKIIMEWINEHVFLEDLSTSDLLKHPTGLFAGLMTMKESGIDSIPTDELHEWAHVMGYSLRDDV